ncbi:hypothetical protein [Delftia tsuruhatensis]|uniref:hypothetical protein n=1 Tax=Delftia tsuruhatensis TaxID=180282 RepID=UPI00244CBEFB|nr:hypothetical protein [Delftia tsuruhatensis]MDH0423535.1 hypothetical protein [Delftia tsuruhatensis]
MLNSEEAKKQQQQLRVALSDLRETVFVLSETSDELHRERTLTAVAAITAVDSLVTQLADVPQSFPKAIQTFWSQEARLKAKAVYDEALEKAVKADAGSLASVLGIDSSLLGATLLSSSLISALGSRHVLGLATVLGRPALAYGISSAVTASLVGTLGTGLVARAALAPTVAIPVAGQVIGAGLLAFSAWSLYDTSKKNAKVAEDAGAARAEVSKLTAQLKLQFKYVEYLQTQTKRLLASITEDVRKLLRSNHAANYREMTEGDQDLLAGIINNVMALSVLMTRTADDAVAEAAAEAEREASTL